MGKVEHCFANLSAVSVTESCTTTDSNSTCLSDSMAVVRLWDKFKWKTSS